MQIKRDCLKAETQQQQEQQHVNQQGQLQQQQLKAQQEVSMHRMRAEAGTTEGDNVFRYIFFPRKVDAVKHDKKFTSKTEIFLQKYLEKLMM